MADEMSLNGKLMLIQSELKAPKGQRNTFGKYNYRSCEDIFEAVKPLLCKYDCVLTVTDDLVMIGQRYYIKATATIRSGSESQTVCAFARESEEKKGMDASQVTGATSSYARKYALNGLFLIDDSKDADTDEYQQQTSQIISDKEREVLINLMQKHGMDTSKVPARVARADYVKYMRRFQSDERNGQ